MRAIQLTRGKVAFVDDEDYESVSDFSWRAVLCNGKWYARAYVGGGASNPVDKYLHHLLLGGIRVDHIDSNGLNNCRDNLRPATQQQNRWNSASHSDAISKFKGVSVDPRRKKKWRARILCSGKSHWLGYFYSEQEAADAYDKSAKELFGEFAKLNRV